MHEFEFNERIMGTDLSVALITKDEVVATNIFQELLTRLHTHEAQFSRFQETSELSKLNRERSCTVSPFFITLLKIAKNLYTKTDGYFNPLLQIERLGYTKTFEILDETISIHDTLPYNTNLTMLSIDETTNVVTLVDDQKLDFGGFLKGYLAEAEAKRIIQSYPDIQGIIVNIGGDLYTQGHDAHGNIFVFDITNPITNHPIAVPLENTSLATSGTYKHTWNTLTLPIHHILAREGTHNPKTSVISASIIHSDGATAEAYAKTLLSLTPETLESLVGERLEYVVIHKDGTVKTSL